MHCNLVVWVFKCMFYSVVVLDQFCYCSNCRVVKSYFTQVHTYNVYQVLFEGF